ncbi:hypothetical protein [Sorangium sp. So ce1335]|uniref:hypothetical protein n=1 Tax=Sorangium sp. So ce1335 TaxID=3133335 RepID=UPI003F623801
MRDVERAPGGEPVVAEVGPFRLRLLPSAHSRLMLGVERAPGPKPPGHRMLSKVHRLTDRGQRLLDKGLDRLTDAPSLPVGGIDAYSASAPWVQLEDGRLARA